MSILNTEFYLDVVLHSIILFTFLSVFYIFYIAELSKNTFDNEIKHNIDALVKNYTQNEKNNKLLNTIPYDYLIQMVEKESDYVKIQNEWVYGTLKIGLIAVWIMFIGLIILLKNKCGEEIDVISMVKNNLVTFVFIGFAEYLFFVNIATKFIPIKPSVLTDTFVSDLKKMF